MRLALLTLLLILCGQVVADPNWRENGSSRAAVEGGQCVRETAWMRRNHMELLKHDRDITVHQGVRTIDGSLSGCIACHANRDGDRYLAVNAEDQFCAGCHTFAGVRMDCFTCHTAVPNDEPKVRGAANVVDGAARVSGVVR